MRDRRTPAEAAVLRDAVLDRWAAGVSGTLLTAALGLNPSHVSVILYDARRRGDPRAGFRYAVAGRIRMSAPPEPVPAPEPIVVDVPRMALLRACQAAIPGKDGERHRREAILDAWHAGMDAPQIGATLGMRWKSVGMVVQRARARGDRRAVRRQHDCRDGLSVSYRRTLDRLDRRYGVIASIQEIHP